MRSFHSRLWEHTLFPALCVLGELLSLFLFSWFSPRLLESHCLHVQISSVQDSKGLHYSSEKLSPTVWLLLSGILAALASPNSHLSSLLSKTETAELSLGFPFLSLSLKTKAAVGWAGPRVGRTTVFVSLLSQSYPAQNSMSEDSFISCISSGFLVVYGRTAICVAIISSWATWKSRWFLMTPWNRILPTITFWKHSGYSVSRSLPRRKQKRLWSFFFLENL